MPEDVTSEGGKGPTLLTASANTTASAVTYDHHGQNPRMTRRTRCFFFGFLGFLGPPGPGFTGAEVFPAEAVATGRNRQGGVMSAGGAVTGGSGLSWAAGRTARGSPLRVLLAVGHLSMVRHPVNNVSRNLETCVADPHQGDGVNCLPTKCCFPTRVGDRRGVKTCRVVAAEVFPQPCKSTDAGVAGTGRRRS